jgi:hypothetical protein
MGSAPSRLVEQLEAEARAATLAALPAAADLVNRILRTTAAGLDAVKEGQHPGKPRPRWLDLRLLLATRSWNTVRVAHGALVNGYPVQAVILTRSALEDYAASRYVERDHRSARFFLSRKHAEYTGSKPWLGKPKKPKKPGLGPQLGRTAQITALAGGEKDALKSLTLLYHELSQVAHPLALGMALQKNETAETDEYHLGAGFRLDHALRTYWLLILVGTWNLGIIEGFVGDRAPDWQGHLKQVYRDALAWVTEYDRFVRAREQGKIGQAGQGTPGAGSAP